MGAPRGKLPAGVQLNQVKRLLSAPCNGKWSLAVELALPAIGEGLAVLLVPDPQQILQNYLRPKGGRGGTRFLAPLTRRSTFSASRRKYRTFGGGFPDVDQMIGDSLPGRGFFGGRSAGGLEKWFWTGLEFSDLVGWYWLLTSVATNGLNTWSSNIFHSLVCHSTSSLAGSWKHNYSSGGILPPWQTGFEPWLHEEKNCTFGGLGLFRARDLSTMNNCYVNAVATFEGVGFAQMGPFSLNLWRDGTPVYSAIDGSVDELGVGDIGRLQCEAHFEYTGEWTHGFIGMATGSGAGYENRGALIEGQIFGGYS